MFCILFSPFLASVSFTFLTVLSAVHEKTLPGHYSSAFYTVTLTVS